MACADGEETRAPRQNRVKDSSRIPAVGPRAAAVPSAQREQPQPSSVPGLVTPLAVVTQVVPELPAEYLRLREEVQVTAAKDDEFLRRRRLPGNHEQAARDIFDAVAVGVKRHHAVRVLEQPDVIGQPLQMTEWRIGVLHPAAAVALRPCAEPVSARHGVDGDAAELIRVSPAETGSGESQCAPEAD